MAKYTAKTLRDEIAIEAMKAMIIHGKTEERNTEYISKKSYAIADAMLNAGGKL